jgi:hypothetical protein
MPDRRNSPSPGTNVKGPNDTGPRSARDSRSMPLVAFDGSLGPPVPPVEIGPLGGLAASYSSAWMVDPVPRHGADRATPGRSTDGHKITPRYLHKLFESDGTTYSAFVLAQRLTRSIGCSPTYGLSADRSARSRSTSGWEICRTSTANSSAATTPLHRTCGVSVRRVVMEIRRSRPSSEFVENGGQTLESVIPGGSQR